MNLLLKQGRTKVHQGRQIDLSSLLSFYPCLLYQKLRWNFVTFYLLLFQYHCALWDYLYEILSRIYVIRCIRELACTHNRRERCTRWSYQLNWSHYFPIQESYARLRGEIFAVFSSPRINWPHPHGHPWYMNLSDRLIASIRATHQTHQITKSDHQTCSSSREQ